VPDKGQCFLDPSDDSGTSANYMHAMLTITWNTHRKSSGGAGAQIYEEMFEPNAEFLTQDYTKFRWGAGTGQNAEMLKPGETPGLLVKTGDYRLTMYQVSLIPDWVMNLYGCVNSNPVMTRSMGLIFPPETLYYNPPEITHGATIGQADSWTLATRWSFKPWTWNKFWNAKANNGSGGFDFMYVAGQTQPYKPFTPQLFPSPI
jgi:hypothetical protein